MPVVSDIAWAISVKYKTFATGRARIGDG